MTSEIVEQKDYQIDLEFNYEIKEDENGNSGKIVFLTTAFDEINEDGKRCFHRISRGSLAFTLDQLGDESDQKLGMTIEDQSGSFGFLSTSGIDTTVHHRWVRENAKFKTVLDLREPRFGKLQFTCKSL